MQKTPITILILVFLAVLGFFVLNSSPSGSGEKNADVSLVADYKNGWYTVAGTSVHLVNGVSKIPAAPGSTSMITTQYFGNEVVADIDKDGDDDVAFIMTQDGGGSGIFFYLVGAIKEENGYRGTQAVLIGDRIAPQTTEFRDGLVIVNYADRAPGEAMAALPSIGKSLYLKYDPASMQFGEVVRDFEGEHTNTDTFARVSGHRGEKISALDVSVTVNKILEDSRCPEDVVCIQAGTVRVVATLQSGLGTAANQEFRLNEPITTEAEEITLTQVAPVPNSKRTIQDTDYLFYFEIKKR